MCGIAGIHAYLDVARAVDRAELGRINDRMAARGPDGSGLWLSADGRTGFGHQRLAIIDLSDAGAQPMHSACGRYTITFNGEIYNYRELRDELAARGHTFRSGSDTEVLLQLYADCGADMVRKLRGMFAFGLWDAQKRTLLLARDALGIKPLYWADDGWTVRFASQAKALLASGRIGRDVDSAGVVGGIVGQGIGGQKGQYWADVHRPITPVAWRFRRPLRRRGLGRSPRRVASARLYGFSS